MTVGFFGYLFGIIGAVVAGAVVVSIWYLIYHYKLNKQINRFGIPKDKKEISKWIKDNKEDLKDGGNTSILDRKEAELDEQRRNAKFRELDKLRASTLGSSKVNNSSPRIPGFEFNGQQSSISSEPKLKSATDKPELDLD